MSIFLTKNSHTHPFLYMKGVRMADMESIVHFMYHGEANVALEDLESFLAAANELQIKGLTAPSVNQFKKSLKQEQAIVTPPPSKKVKKEKQPEQEAKVSNASRFRDVFRNFGFRPLNLGSIANNGMGDIAIEIFRLCQLMI